ncbi:MAG: single-stranded DNA-binding protein [Acidaminococcaceae bacterium]|nr:single-stranded DNA-binding protein [Acidaminococcaceae bacterium]
MNRIILMGRLTRDPEVRITPTEKTVCTFTLAVDRPFTSKDGQREADFINIVVWGKSAELCGNNVSKGQRLLVEGRLQLRNYVAKDGNKRYVTEVIADRIEFVERKSSGTNSGGPKPTGGTENKTEEKTGMESFGSTVGFDEEIPF